MPLREYVRDVELVLLVWVASLLLIASAAIRAIRHLRRPSMKLLAADEEGVSYSLSYVLVFPVLLLFVCRKWSGTARGRDGQRLQWLRPNALFALDMPPADRPLLGLLAALL